jgi:hypothetical protein
MEYRRQIVLMALQADMTPVDGPTLFDPVVEAQPVGSA